MASTIMDGVIIERDVMLAAASLVTPGKHLESGFLYAGAPARQVRPLRDEEHEYIEWSYRHYSELKYKHRDAMRGSRESTVDQSVS
jgi:carbonic anhydrase/acetyltransferase-like protein (isoleucine patch superfamily)